jgi:hypothetical protein
LLLVDAARDSITPSIELMTLPAEVVAGTHS